MATTGPERPDMRRYLSIDILRGLAIILMIQVHFVENLSPRDGDFAWLYNASIVLGSFPAPFFTFVSGLSLYLWLRKQQIERRRDVEVTKIMLRRGIFLFVLGIAFNFFIWLPEEIFNWDILTLIGSSFLFLAFARKLPLVVLTLICTMVLLVSPIVRVVGDFSAYWDDHAYTYDFTFRDIIFGYFANGYFPVFPWIIFPIAGFVCGALIFRPRTVSAVVLWRLSALGIGLLALSGILIAAGSYLPTFIARRYAHALSEFPASTEFVLAMLGCLFLSLVFLHRWLDCDEGGERVGSFLAVFQRFSLFSLTVYVVHHLVILWPLWFYGTWTGHKDPTYYWRGAMNTPLAFGLAAAFILVCHFALIVLEKHRAFSLEWLMRWFCD